MPLCVFQKLFPIWLDVNGKPTGLHPTVTQLTAYNGIAIPQLGTHDTAIEWGPSSHGPPKCVHTWWYTADISGPAILGLPSSLKLAVMQLNCAIQFPHKCCTSDPPRRPTTEHEKVASDLLHLWKPPMQHRWSPLPPLNSSKDLFAAYPDHFEGIGCFLWNVHNSPSQQCTTCHPCTLQVSNHHVSTYCAWHAGWIPWAGDHRTSYTTYWLGLLTCLFMEGQWRTMGLYRPQGSSVLISAMTTTLSKPWMRSPTSLAVVHASQSWMAHLPTCVSSSTMTSSLLTTFNTLWGCYRFVHLPWGLVCTQDIFQQMMDQIL